MVVVSVNSEEIGEIQSSKSGGLKRKGVVKLFLPHRHTGDRKNKKETIKKVKVKSMEKFTAKKAKPIFTTAPEGCPLGLAPILTETQWDKRGLFFCHFERSEKS